MPDGKPAGVRCIHLSEENKCTIYTYSIRPKVCADFKADPEFCGSGREEALIILGSLTK
jgi:uncharacterized protein